MLTSFLIVAVTTNPIPDMIASLESVVEHIDKVISNFTRLVERRTTRCSELLQNTDRLIEIGNITASKDEIFELSDDITGAAINISSCNIIQIEELKEDKIKLNQIICHLKERIGLYCLFLFLLRFVYGWKKMSFKEQR